jgi:pSer/pThr/pTyr-binding forkhead associated (FHA) protein
MLEPGEDWPEYEPQLAVKDAKPFLVSRNHFVIESKPGHIIVRDLNSKMGTAVNGQPIGRHFARDSAELKFGPNLIIAGGLESRFRFMITVA